MPKLEEINRQIDVIRSIFSTAQIEAIRNALGLLVIELEQHRDLKRCYSYKGAWDVDEFTRVTDLYRLYDMAMQEAGQ